VVCEMRDEVMSALYPETFHDGFIFYLLFKYCSYPCLTESFCITALHIFTLACRFLVLSNNLHLKVMWECNVNEEDNLAEIQR